MRSASWWGSIHASIYAVTVLKTQLTLEFTATQILQEGNSATPLRQGQKESAIEGTGDQNCNYLGKHAIIISWPVVMISCKQVPFEVKSIRRWSSSLKFAEGFADFFMHFQAKKLELLLSVKRISYDRLGPPIFWKLSVLAAGNEGGKLQWAEVHARASRHCTHAKAQGTIQDQATMQPHSNTEVLIKTRIQQCKSHNSARITVLDQYLNVTDIPYLYGLHFVWKRKIRFGKLWSFPWLKELYTIY